MTSLPGTADHQRVLEAVRDRYGTDPRVRGIIMFGSLGRGNWEEDSDVDLDIVLADGVPFELDAELALLGDDFGRRGDPAIVILCVGDDAGELVLASLTGVSIRFHPLASTSPNILGSMVLLGGDVGTEEITRAGKANARPGPEIADLLAQCVRYTVETDRFLRRGQLWLAIECLHRLRAGFMALYSETHSGTRSLQTFAASAPRTLQRRMARTLPQLEFESIHAALNQAIDLLTEDLDTLTAGRIALTVAQRNALARIAARR